MPISFSVAILLLLSIVFVGSSTVAAFSDEATIVTPDEETGRVSRRSNVLSAPIDLATIADAPLDRLVPSWVRVQAGSGQFKWGTSNATLGLIVPGFRSTSSCRGSEVISLYVAVGDFTEMRRLQTDGGCTKANVTTAFASLSKDGYHRMAYIGDLRCSKSNYEAVVSEENVTLVDLPFRYSPTGGWKPSIRIFSGRYGAAVFAFVSSGVCVKSVDIPFEFELVPAYVIGTVMYETDMLDAKPIVIPQYSQAVTDDSPRITPFVIAVVVLSAVALFMLTFAVTMRCYFPIRKWFFSRCYARGRCGTSVVRYCLCSRSANLDESDPSSSMFTVNNEVGDLSMLLSTTTCADDWVERMEIQYGDLPANDPVRKQLSERFVNIDKRYRHLLSQELKDCAQKWRAQVVRVRQEQEWGQRMEEMAHRRSEREAARRRLEEEQILLQREDEEEREMFARMDQQLRLETPPDLIVGALEEQPVSLPNVAPQDVFSV